MSYFGIGTPFKNFKKEEEDFVDAAITTEEISLLHGAYSEYGHRPFTVKSRINKTIAFDLLHRGYLALVSSSAKSDTFVVTKKGLSALKKYGYAHTRKGYGGSSGSAPWMQKSSRFGSNGSPVYIPKLDE